uniref:Uncharacterized protein n=1 Tax=Anguilla anguilla TaxID=7936 RepID=A0A0E9X5R2_ANGAN
MRYLAHKQINSYRLLKNVKETSAFTSTRKIFPKFVRFGNILCLGSAGVFSILSASHLKVFKTHI